MSSRVKRGQAYSTPHRPGLRQVCGVYRIDDKTVRRVLLAGDLLYTQRTDGPPRPVRPQSETEFFYEGQPSRLTFVTGDDGKVTHRTIYQNGREEKAVKVE